MKVSQIYDTYYPPYMYIKLNSGLELRVWCRGKNKFNWIERSKYDIGKKIQDTGIVKFLNWLKPKCDANEKKILQTKLKPILKKLEDAGVRLYKKVRSWRDYDLWKEIENHAWAKSGNPAAKALEWYRKKIKIDKDYHFKAKLLRQGFLYTFNYDTPKYESVLDYFDTQPLVIAFGSAQTSLGLRDIGINLHLLPPRIRRIVMYKVFEMYRNHYKDQLFKNRNKQVPVGVTWKDIARPLEKYGIAFAIRMYIPELRTNAIEFMYDDWASAVYLPSKRLSKITQEELEKLWQKFVRDQHKKGEGKGLKESWRMS